MSLVGAIEPSLRLAEIERAKRKRPENLDAYDLYLRALQHAYLRCRARQTRRSLCFDQVLRSTRTTLRRMRPPPGATKYAICAVVCMRRTKSRARHARAAIEAGADDAATLATAGFVIGLVAHDYETAIEVIDRALTLTGASAAALWMGATILAHAGDTAKAVDYADAPCA